MEVGAKTGDLTEASQDDRKVANISFNWSHKHHHVIRIERGVRNDTPSPNLMEKPLSRCQLEDLLQWVDGDGEEKWEERPPCRRPRPCLMGGPATPFKSILEEEKQRRAAIQSLNLLRNPLHWRRSRIYSHLTESKAFRMSSLKRRDRVLRLWSRQARFQTYMKLS